MWNSKEGAGKRRGAGKWRRGNRGGGDGEESAREQGKYESIGTVEVHNKL